MSIRERIRFTLYGKGLLLIGLPLALEVLFILILSVLLRQAASDALLVEQRYRDLQRCQNIASGWMLLESIEEKYFFSGDTRYLSILDEPLKDISSEIDRLGTEESDPREAKHLRALRDLLKRQLEYVGSYKQYDRYASVGKAREIGTSVLITLRSLSSEAETILKVRLAHQQRLREAIAVIIAVALSFNLLLALALSVFFSKSITSRIFILSDNTQRLSCGMPLNPGVKGTDEITLLDRAFHDMAEALAKAARDLHDSEERMRTVIASMPVGLITLTGTGSIKAANPRAREIFAYEEPQLVGAHISRLIPSAGRDTFSQAPDAPQPIHFNGGSSEGCTSDGRKFPIDVAISELTTPEGALVLASIQDISQRRRIEQLKQEFVSMVSHDLRTPLSSVSLTLNMLNDGVYGELSAEVLKILRNAGSNVHRLISLINDLLDIEKMESGKLKMEFDYVRLSSVIEKAVDSVRALSEQRQIAVVKPQANKVIVGDSDRLVQVLANFLTNALNYSPSGSAVEIALSEKGQTVELSVTDDGPVVGEAWRQAIFERFQGADDAPCPRRDGTGVTLSVCRAIIEGHHGTIGVRDGCSGSNMFWFAIPCAHEEEDTNGQV